MTDEELRKLVASLATSTANNASEARANTEAITRQAEAIRELRATVEIQAQRSEGQDRANAEAIRELRVTTEEQGRTIKEGLATLQASSESQLRSIEFIREGMTYNTETMASALELAAISQRTAAAAQETAAASQVTAAAAMELSANTSRNIDRLEKNIDRLEEMMGIVIGEGRADRGRITRLEEQN